MKTNKKLSDAAESNAGDDFHVLWTLKRSLDLLNFKDNGLKAIIVEGVEAELAAKIDISGQRFLGADLVEYFGGERFHEASSVIVSQLKYSTRRTAENITISELYTQKRGPGSSIIAKLAKIHQAFQQISGNDEIKAKVSYRLVTNRLFSDSQLKQLQALQDRLVKESKLEWSAAIKYITTSKKSLEKLYAASGLNDQDFALFFSLIDFSYCGTNSTTILEQELIWAIAKTTVSSRNQFNGLYKMISDKMLPDAPTKITVIDIIANLGFTNGSLESLFPVSQEFEKVYNPILRAQVSDIVDEILDPSGSPIICLHGRAGIGKSTLTQQLQNLLPLHSFCLRFDCYGAGAYLDSDDRRHFHRYGIVHLCNELAKEFGTDFLVNFSEAKEIYIKELKRRIADAVRILKQRDPDAMLLIIIDAADNSITAAQKMSELSFVPDLLSMAIPAGCKIMATSRSYRKDSLELPAVYTDIELKPFSLDESSAFLRMYFPDATEEECFLFHELTEGIPRVQSYAVDMRAKGLTDVLNYLKPDGKSVENIIDEKIKEAINRIGSKGTEQVTTFFTYLITFPRPVPMDYLEKASGLSHAVVADLTTDLWHGILLSRGLLSFRDEDFENHIREKYTAIALQVKTIAELFIEKALIDEYASINLASTLLQAEMGERLKEIVLNRDLMNLPLDPIRNKEVYGRRTQLALKVSTEQNDIPAYIKLLLIAAEEAKTGTALHRLQVDNPELIMQFGHPASLSLISQETSNATWGGSFHMKLAAFSARNGDHKDARRQLITAHNWLAWKNDSVPDNEKYLYPISDYDIASETEALFYLKGMETAWRNLLRWSPASHHIEIGKLVASQLVTNVDSGELGGQASSIKWRLDSLLFIFCKASLYHIPTGLNIGVTVARLKRAMSLLSLLKGKLSREFKALISDFCKIALFDQSVAKGDILSILENVEYSLPRHLPFYLKKVSHGERDGEDMHIAFSFMSLKSYCKASKLQIKDVMPIHLLNFDSEKDYAKREDLNRERREYESFYKYVVAIHNLQAMLTAGPSAHEFARGEIDRICEQISRDYEFSYLNRIRSQERMGYIAQELFVIVRALPDAEQLLQKILNTAQGNVYMVSVWYILLDKTSHVTSLQPFHLKILRGLEAHLEKGAYPASELTENYLKCCLYSQKIDMDTAKYYFDKALNAVNDIDDDAIAKINCLRDLSEVGLPSHNKELAFNVARFTEYCRIKLSQYDQEQFPFLQSLGAIAAIDPATVFPTLCRWDHRDILRIEGYIIPVIDDMLKMKYIDHGVAAGLLPLGSRYNYWHQFVTLCKSILDGFDQAQDSEGKSAFLRVLLRDRTLGQDYKMIEAIYEHIAHGRYVQAALLKEFKDIIEFEQTINGKEVKAPYKNPENQDLAHGLDISGYDHLSTAGLETALKALKSTDEDYNSWQYPGILLIDFSEKCLPRHYVQFLDALIDVSAELLSSHTLHDSLSDIFGKWADHQGVRSWKKRNFQRVTIHWFDHIYNDGRFNFYEIQKSQKVFGLTDNELADVLISLLPSKIEILTPDSIYNIVRIILSRINPEQNLDILQWLVPKWSESIKADFADGVYCAKLSPAKDAVDSIAGVLRYMLGHPYKPKRWMAMYSLRHLTKLSSISFLQSLLDRQDNASNLPFQDEGTLYYWISAKLYLHIAIERISREHPEKLLALKETLFYGMDNTDLPHVLINHYIRLSCFNLHQSYSNIFKEEQLQKLQSLFSGVEKKAMKSKPTQSFSNDDNDDERGFWFNTIDTLPYWYSPLAQLFAVSTSQVTEVAEKFILEKWGYDKNYNAEKLVRIINNEQGYDITGNGHGKVPKLEDTDTYFEYHALFCAAGALLASEPLAKRKSYQRSFDKWLKSHANARKGFWLADLRDALPLEERYWDYPHSGLGKSWAEGISDTELDNELGFNRKDGNLVLYGEISKYIGPNTERVGIRSALVSEKGAQPLLRALQTVDDYRDYAIIFENDHYHKDIDYKGFKLQGWIRHKNSEYEGIDRHDEKATETARYYARLGNVVKDHFGIVLSKDKKLCTLDGQIISKYINWDEAPMDERDRLYGETYENKGEVLLINRTFLLQFLQKLNRHLIVECSIERHTGKKSYYRDKKEDSFEGEKVKIYLIRNDGTVQTVRGEDFTIR